MKSVLIYIGIVGLVMVGVGTYAKMTHKRNTASLTTSSVVGVNTPSASPMSDVSLNLKRVLKVNVPDEQVVVLVGEIGENAS
ncbi:MAG TPA: hypothetical protein VKR58_14465, partial [Aquella sp.]|nr:hypothetical protein [Aquella sp.]